MARAQVGRGQAPHTARRLHSLHWKRACACRHGFAGVRERASPLLQRPGTTAPCTSGRGATVGRPHVVTPRRPLLLQASDDDVSEAESFEFDEPTGLFGTSLPEMDHFGVVGSFAAPPLAFGAGSLPRNGSWHRAARLSPLPPPPAHAEGLLEVTADMEAGIPEEGATSLPPSLATARAAPTTSALSAALQASEGVAALGTPTTKAGVGGASGDVPAAVLVDAESPWLEVRRIVVLAAPVSLTNVLSYALSMVAIASVGRLGSAPLAACVLAISVSWPRVRGGGGERRCHAAAAAAVLAEMGSRAVCVWWGGRHCGRYVSVMPHASCTHPPPPFPACNSLEKCLPPRPSSHPQPNCRVRRFTT